MLGGGTGGGTGGVQARGRAGRRGEREGAWFLFCHNGLFFFWAKKAQ